MSCLTLTPSIATYIYVVNTAVYYICHVSCRRVCLFEFPYLAACQTSEKGEKEVEAVSEVHLGVEKTVHVHKQPNASIYIYMNGLISTYTYN